MPPLIRCTEKGHTGWFMLNKNELESIRAYQSQWNSHDQGLDLRHICFVCVCFLSLNFRLSLLVSFKLVGHYAHFDLSRYIIKTYSHYL